MVKEERDLYFVSDSVNEYDRGGSVDIKWETTWNKKLEMVSVKRDGMDAEAALLDPGHYYHMEVVTAESRHQELLQSYMITQPNEPAAPYLILSRGFLSRHVCIAEMEVRLSPKMVFFPDGKLRRDTLILTEATPEKRTLVEEYNIELCAFQQKQKELLLAIFGEEQQRTLERI